MNENTRVADSNLTNKILYIEDNPNNARLFRKLLYKYPQTVQIAPTAGEGLEILENEQFDCIFLDINLPDIDGLTLVKQLKANKRYQNTPIIALTANTMAGDRELYLASGFDGYIAKPIMRVELYYTMSKIFGSHPQV